MAAESETFMALGLSDESSRGGSGTPRVLVLIASVLEKSLQKNEKLLTTSRRKDAITIFHGSRSPTLSIRQYIERVFKYSRCSTSCFVVAYIYINKFLQQTGASLTSLNAHRLLITSIMVAAKFLDDDQSSISIFRDWCYDNAYYARIGGVSTAEMNGMEMKFLFNLDFRLHVTAEVFMNCCLKLQNESGEYQNVQANPSSWPRRRPARQR
ncbi:hypothetical protein POTOM_043820 [Populus tomentosa]|uniref:Cyclin n=1 Tax=Populus tomentosa TaxID=118781 RepID=A0A8X7YNC7_POPTO|nr:hypothetical protein POTOM_043820 [Populus tomentosa]